MGKGPIVDCVHELRGLESKALDTGFVLMYFLQLALTYMDERRYVNSGWNRLPHS